MRKLLHNLGALADLGAEISSTASFEEVTRSSLYTMLGALAVPKGAIARYWSRPRMLRVVAARGVPKAEGVSIALGRDEVEKLVERARPFEIGRPPAQLARFASRNREVFESLRAKTIAPMVTRAELMGIVTASNKIDGTTLADDEAEILNTISRHIAIAFHNHMLMLSLQRKSDENRRLYRGMRRMFQDTIRAFGAAIDLKDAYTKGHSDRVARYSGAIARELGITGQELEHIEVAGYLHDIGKIVIEKAIINNPRPLTDREFSELNRHVNTGYEILSSISHPWTAIAHMTRCHHEKVDGSGYPQGLRDDEIPLGSKIVTLADSFDAMMTDRPYRSRLSLDRALNELRWNTGTQFAAEVVSAFCRVLLREISGNARQRVLIPMIGLKFDRDSVTNLLDSMITELNGRVG